MLLAVAALGATVSPTLRAVDPPELTVSVAPAPPANGAIRLSLEETARRSLVSNAALAVRRLDPDVATAQADAERGAFDYVVTLDAQAQGEETPTGSQLQGAAVADVDRQFVNAGVERRFDSGTVATARFLNERFETNSAFQLVNPQYASTLVFSVVHPLARGAGRRVNTADLQIAKNAIEQGRMRLLTTMLETVASAERRYWDLASARREREVQVAAQQSALAVVAFARGRHENGIGTESDIIEAQSAAAARAADVAAMDRQVSDAEEALRLLIGLRDRGAAELFPVDPLPSPGPDVPLPRALTTAFAKRPDRRDLLIELESRDIRVVFLENQTQPRIDLVASYGQNGLSGGYGTTLGQVFEGDFQGYALGVQVALPIENRTARADHRRGLIEKRQALLGLRALEDRIEQEVRRAVRAVAADRRRAEAANVAEGLAARQLTFATRRFHEGLLTNIELLRFQQELAIARSRRFRATYDLVRSKVDVDAATGELLPARGIRVEPLPLTRAAH